MYVNTLLNYAKKVIIFGTNTPAYFVPPSVTKKFLTLPLGPSRRDDIF
jgi:hypothetical protein